MRTRRRTGDATSLRPAYLGRCLRAVAAQGALPDETVVVVKEG
jgi:hypothetical protein